MAQLDIQHWEQRCRAALDWIYRSIEACEGQGSAHSYALFRGWTKAYPETTGYLIETLLEHHAGFSSAERNYRDIALRCSDWLETLQLPSGAFPGLLAGSTNPSVFNTGQILFGLLQTQKQESAKRAADWLLKIQEPNGAWMKAAYQPGFEPTYYTRVIWPLLLFSLQYPGLIPDLPEKMRGALWRYSQRFLANGTVKDWGFQTGKPAFTHTIAYTLEGFWMSALLLGEAEILEKTEKSTRKIIERRRDKGKTAGAYSEDWSGDYSFLCPTGNAQLSLLCHRIWKQQGDPYFARAADDFLLEMLPAQSNSLLLSTRGGISGSSPIWGKYQRFRYPNWAAKFFLDAMHAFGIRNF